MRIMPIYSSPSPRLAIRREHYATPRQQQEEIAQMEFMISSLHSLDLVV